MSLSCYQYNKHKTKLKLCGFYNKKSFIFKILKSNFVSGKFLKVRSSINHPWGRGLTTNLGLISSAVLTFIGHKQTNGHHDKQSIEILHNTLQVYRVLTFFQRRLYGIYTVCFLIFMVQQ